MLEGLEKHSSGTYTIGPEEYWKGAAKPSLGLSFPVLVKEYEGEVTIFHWHTSPPYTLAVSGEPTESGRRKAAALMRDMVAHLTTERLSYPMAQLTVAAVDKSGDYARRVLEDWDYLKPVFDHVAPLAPGFPRLAKGSEFQGDLGRAPDADEQFLLFGVCLPPNAEHLRWLIMYLYHEVLTHGESIAETRIVDASALTLECPREIPADTRMANGAANTDLPDGMVLNHIYMVTPVEDPVMMRGAAVLRNRDKQIIDVALSCLAACSLTGAGFSALLHPTADTTTARARRLHQVQHFDLDAARAFILVI